MFKMNGAFRKLRRKVTDAAKNIDSLKRVAILRGFAASASKLEPAKVAIICGPGRAKRVTDYQAKMLKLLATIDKLENTLKAGRNDEAGKLVAEFNDHQRADHQEFRLEDKK